MRQLTCDLEITALEKIKWLQAWLLSVYLFVRQWANKKKKNSNRQSSRVCILNEWDQNFFLFLLFPLVFSWNPKVSTSPQGVMTPRLKMATSGWQPKLYLDHLLSRCSIYWASIGLGVLEEWRGLTLVADQQSSVRFMRFVWQLHIAAK